MLRVSGSIGIPLREIEFKTIRSQGSGGQNVNKVSTAIHLFFDIAASSLPNRLKERLTKLKDHRITESGMVVIKAQGTRSQEANREAALDRLKEIVQSVLTEPKRRKPTKATKGSKERRLKSKQMRGRTKSLRRRTGSED